MAAERRWRPPSPIPTGKGSRSAVSPVLSEYIDKSSTVPDLMLPQHIRRRHKPEEISYGSLLFREKDAVRRLLRLATGHGVFGISDHGIPTEELRLALANSDRIFGLTVECLTSYGYHEKLVWRGDDQEMMEKANTVIGDDCFENLWKTMENVAAKLEEVAGELALVMDEIDGEQTTTRTCFNESTLRVYRYHRANIIDRISSSVVDETDRESGPYAFSLHVLLDSGEFCVQTDGRKLLFESSPDAIVVTMGKQIEVSWVVLLRTFFYRVTFTYYTGQIL
ncbi:2-oxoglutarate (2OG) and Fe(II)-dependent oxygenase superfamily protein [Dorcoceras hygrometricum]|uniref:2-oxoglutarate (2OG) and Fe(II)-dependent oxygenase superfamily protein n=1 Tax=Dorcoceras hygrometricum TaxID=472368 RepID=A0A2Z7C895_9LAMI|nr:2-oxoglutarate (2OG) and Fe(II)-dependent oxygenase superfamily protein [Dorcoceras hygrometricum]